MITPFSFSFITNIRRQWRALDKTLQDPTNNANFGALDDARLHPRKPGSAVTLTALTCKKVG